MEKTTLNVADKKKIARRVISKETTPEQLSKELNEPVATILAWAKKYCETENIPVPDFLVTEFNKTQDKRPIRPTLEDQAISLLMLEGLTTKQVAKRLGIGQNVVERYQKNYLENIPAEMKELEISDIPKNSKVKRYSLAFKKQVVKDYAVNEVDTKDLTAKYNVSISSVRRWIELYGSQFAKVHKSDVIDANTTKADLNLDISTIENTVISHLKDEINKLKDENLRLKQIISILVN